MERRWKRNVVSVVSSVIAVILLPSVYSRHLFWGEGIPPTPNGWQIVCYKFFFGRDNELPIYRGNFLFNEL